jgi:chromosome segregation ATPase
MIASLRKIAPLLLLLSLASTAWAQRRSDPLTPLEGDQLREAAQVPGERIKLFIEFARARLASLEKMRADPTTTDRPRQTHDQLQNFLDVYDELNDNIDTFVGRKADLRKPLKSVLEADTEFQARLRALKSSIDSSREETSQYEFILNNLLDTVDSSAQDHRQLLGEQEEAFKHKKK